MGPLAVRASIGVAQQHLVAARGGAVLDASKQCAEEWVGDVRDDHGQDQRLPQLEPTRHAVGPVLGLPQERLDPRAGGWGYAQARVVVGDPGDRRGVDFGSRRQLFQGRGHGVEPMIDIRFTREYDRAIVCSDPGVRGFL